MSVEALEVEVQALWRAQGLQQQLAARPGPRYTFYEGPPSANGMPGLHHLMARTIKDMFCRYKTQQGYRVARRAGWDTHGLPIELQVEKELGITKEDIGQSISISDYNAHCRETVLRYTSAWEAMTKKMGFWIDMQQAYRTCDADYIESVWWLLGQLYDQGLLYKSYSIQPYSPAAGTALSQHELNQPGCYREVKDLAVTAQFKLLDAENSYLLAWTTTPWTLPANSALAVGKDIKYIEVETVNRYSGSPIRAWLAADCLSNYFSEEGRDQPLSYTPGSQQPLPYRVLKTCRGAELQGRRYAQLMPYIPLPAPAFQVFCADFVTTEEGTGVVHISRMFGADDNRLCAAEGIPGVFVQDEKGTDLPIVDKRGRFVSEISDFAGLPVKAFSKEDEHLPPTDLRIVQKLKAEGKAFHISPHLHSYPHCWRTDRPVLYYPIRSWFIRTSACRERLIALNKRIAWQPPSTGEGRFGNWLQQLEDWNLSRSRFWGTPLPIWCSEDGGTQYCISSYAQLHKEVEKAVQAGLMQAGLPKDFDPHRPFVDEIVLLGPEGQPLRREPDVIDVWFDSGAMPYAQWHYPFENKARFEEQFPADFIAEGVDQTRGWFFTLHAIAGMVLNEVAYERVLSCGLVLDKEGRKMSKRLGNTVEPMELLSTYGSDATRWYLMTAASPWESVRFDLEGLAALRRGFFGTLENTFDFFMLYADLDKFRYDKQHCIDVSERLGADKWLILRLRALRKEVEEAYEAYSPLDAGRLLQRFVVEDLSNWYVRLNRKRFWQGEQNPNKQAAYETLYEALLLVVQLAAPIAPFVTEFIYQQLAKIGQQEAKSVHSAPFPSKKEEKDVNWGESIEKGMDYARRICSLVHAIRKQKGIKVRQPLPLVLVAANNSERNEVSLFESLILQEVNVKEFKFVEQLPAIPVKRRVRPVLPRLGPRFGKRLPTIQTALAALGEAQIDMIDMGHPLPLDIDGEQVFLDRQDLLVNSEEIQGWEVAKDYELTVAVDLQLENALIAEGLAREFVNKVQNLRKSEGFEVQDKITIQLHAPPEAAKALRTHTQYICQETQTGHLNWLPQTTNEKVRSEKLKPLLVNQYKLHVQLSRLSTPSEK